MTAALEHLPRNWRVSHTKFLERWLEACDSDHPDYEDVWEEVVERGHQRDADNGLINGRTPNR